MRIQLSIAARASLTYRFLATFNGGRIDIYTGTPPETANHAATGAKLAEVTAPGGLRFEMHGEEAIKHPAQSWTMQGIASGTAGWFRLCGDPSDHGAAEPGLPRLDGPVVLPGGNSVGLQLPNLLITASTQRVIDGFVFTL